MPSKEGDLTNREGEDIAEPLPPRLQTAEGLKAAQIKVYGATFSPPCWKVWALLDFYGVPYEKVQATPHQKVEGVDSAYGKIPKVVIDGEIQINDSAVIVRTLTPILCGKPLTAEQVELEKRNNIRGIIGALEKETVSSGGGLYCAARALTAGWTSTAGRVAAAALPYVAATGWPLGWAAFSLGGMPHGADGDSLTHAKVYRKALGDDAFFHGPEPGALDVTLYASLATFVDYLQAPAAAAALDESGLRRWYHAVEEKLVRVAGKRLHE